MKIVELRPVRETHEEYDRIEARIKRAFKLLLYIPLLKDLSLETSTISNSLDDLVKALQTGRITVSRGTFRGKFDAATSKELKKLGAKWNRKSGTFSLPTTEQPMEIRDAIYTGQQRYRERIARIDKRLSEIKPAEISGKIKTADLFDSILSKTDREVGKTLKGITTVAPKLSDREREKIADEWANNMDLWINNFTENETKKLRRDIARSVFAGNRREVLVKTIQKSYGVTANKAKFLARQETGLLMAKFKESRYTSLGINEYKWRCVAGSPSHPVRPSHKILDGKIFRWDDPPVTTAPDEPLRRNNPGQDYNCRCQAVPIVRFNKEV